MSQTVLITGATRGIGAELAKLYVADGDTVIGTHRGTHPNIEGIRWTKLDVENPAQFAALKDALPDGKLDLLISNAGIFDDRGQSVDDGCPPELWAKTFAINVTAPFLAVQTLLPALQAASPARVAFISSRLGSATQAAGGGYIYRASKSACTNLAVNLSIDLKDRGISVGAYHPGWVRTDMGGPSADVAVEDSAAGLKSCFARLGPETSGCFEAFDGTSLPF